MGFDYARELKCVFLTKHKLEIRSCTSNNGFCLPDATMRTVKSTTEVLNLMKFGEVNRAVSSTAINNRSSRSHRSVWRAVIFFNLVIIRKKIDVFTTKLDIDILSLLSLIIE